MVHQRRVINDEEEAARLTKPIDGVRDEVETEGYQTVFVVFLKLLRIDAAPQGDP